MITNCIYNDFNHMPQLINTISRQGKGNVCEWHASTSLPHSQKTCFTYIIMRETKIINLVLYARSWKLLLIHTIISIKKTHACSMRYCGGRPRFRFKFTSGETHLIYDIATTIFSSLLQGGLCKTWSTLCNAFADVSYKMKNASVIFIYLFEFMTFL